MQNFTYQAEQNIDIEHCFPVDQAAHGTASLTEGCIMNMNAKLMNSVLSYQQW